MSQSDVTHPARIGYVVKVYPRFSETFVVTEILAREATGEDLSIFALRPTTDARFHPALAQVQAPVHHLPRPLKVSQVWDLLARAERNLPDFGARFGALMPLLTRIDQADALQGVELALAARQAGITHLHAHFASAQARAALIASRLTGIPFSVTTHAKDLFHEDVDPQVLREVLAGADRVVAISEFNESHLRATFPELAGRIVLLRNGLDLASFEYADPSPVSPVAPLRVLAVGRLVAKKGFDALIRAAELADRSGTALHVRIAGDGECRDDLAAAISRAGLSASVHLVGPRSQVEIQALLRWADVLVAPCIVGPDGNADGLPTVLLEAMAMGVPVISTEVTGIPEAVHPAGARGPATGVLLAPGDVPALHRALREVTDPAFPRVDIARAARAYVERDHDSTRQAARLRELTRPGAPGTTAAFDRGGVAPVGGLEVAS